MLLMSSVLFILDLDVSMYIRIWVHSSCFSPAHIYNWNDSESATDRSLSVHEAVSLSLSFSQMQIVAYLHRNWFAWPQNDCYL